MLMSVSMIWILHLSLMTLHWRMLQCIIWFKFAQKGLFTFLVFFEGRIHVHIQYTKLKRCMIFLMLRKLSQGRIEDMLYLMKICLNKNNVGHGSWCHGHNIIFHVHVLVGSMYVVLHSMFVRWLAMFRNLWWKIHNSVGQALATLFDKKSHHLMTFRYVRNVLRIRTLWYY